MGFNLSIALLLALALVPGCSLAAFINGADLRIPFSKKTALNTEIATSWVSSVDRRGIGDTLFSCKITIALCIFTFLHLKSSIRRSGPGSNIYAKCDGQIMLTAAYGGVHLAAWDSNIATVTEKWLWRSCCLHITGFNVPVILIASLVRRLDGIYEPSCWAYKSRRRAFGTQFLPCPPTGNEICHRVVCKSKKHILIAATLLVQRLLNLKLFFLTIGVAAYVFARLFLDIDSSINL